jgi:isoamylase
LNGQGIRSKGPKGETIIDDSFYVIFNAYHDKLEYTLPPEKYGTQWIKVLDTSENLVDEDRGDFAAGEAIIVQGRSTVVLKQQDNLLL